MLTWKLLKETHPITTNNGVPTHKTYYAKVNCGYLVETWAPDEEG